MPSIRVLTVDDQAIFRDAVSDLLDDTPGFRSVGQASCGPDAIEAVERMPVDLVLLDVRMPGMDGIESARRIVARDPEVVVVLVSADEPEDLPDDVGACGAAACLRKRDLSPSRLQRLWASVGPGRSAA